MSEYKAVMESLGDTPEPFFGNCPTHNKRTTVIGGSVYTWVRLHDGTQISQPEHFRREGVCCWVAIAERDAPAEDLDW